MTTQAPAPWPDWVYLVRHGQSAGNVARDRAEAGDELEIRIDADRDMDVPLSPLGERQADALGDWLRGQSPDSRPTVVLTSPYLRARQTAERLGREGANSPTKIPLVVDERLREREFGLIDRLTAKGIRHRYPEQAELYAKIKKFYYRPPGGESWCDVILRLRSVLDSLSRDYAGERVMIVCHSAVILCFRYLFERLGEEQILTIDRAQEVANCSLTRYRFDPAAGVRGELVLDQFNYVVPVAAAGEAVTTKSDRPVGTP